MSLIHDAAAAGLRLLDPETAHRLALQGLRTGLGPMVRAKAWPNLATTLAGFRLPNPLGLAAGFDKDAEAPDGLLRAGFGFVECGTVTPLPQAGNPRPRLFRLREDGAVINRMGFNNGGLDGFVARLAARQKFSGVVGANVGANKDSADRAGDYALGLTRVWPYCAYVTINISSPNTPGLRGLQEKGALVDLLARVNEARASVVSAHGQKPVFLKVAPDLDETAILDIAEIALSYRLDGLIVSNTTIERPGSLRNRHRTQAGGLSGRPLFTRSTAVLKSFAQASKGRLALIGVGGIDSGAAALAKIKAGASAVQLYSALALKGPGLAGVILRDLSLRLKAEGFATVAAAVGVDAR